jgi:acylphosphatase
MILHRFQRRSRPLRRTAVAAALLLGLASSMASSVASPSIDAEEDAAKAAGADAAVPGGKIEVDGKARTVAIDAVAAKQGTYEVLKGAIEYVLVARGGKDYETLFVTGCDPVDLLKALEKIGLKPGAPAGEEKAPSGAPLRIAAEYEKDGKKTRRPVDDFVRYKESGKTLEASTWTLTGSLKSLDPKSDREVLQCAVTKSLIGLHYTDASPLLQNPRDEAKKENIYAANLDLLPPAGTAVKLIFEAAKGEVAPGTVRKHVFASGRVQGVGYRAFVEREAKKLKLVGFVKNLADGRVEAVIEGPSAAVDELLKKLERGPRGARVEKIDAKEEPAEGLLKDFAIEY